ncbi:hypothetical protein PEC301879_23400 [Pectobacterium carotovorum subsp. carotovorum]|nr:hypothetical protein PEC301879_23400 [Pectobacterium carotovorum subsp. carotovorum]
MLGTLLFNLVIGYSRSTQEKIDSTLWRNSTLQTGV